MRQDHIGPPPPLALSRSAVGQQRCITGILRLAASEAITGRRIAVTTRPTTLSAGAVAAWATPVTSPIGWWPSDCRPWMAIALPTGGLGPRASTRRIAARATTRVPATPARAGMSFSWTSAPRTARQKQVSNYRFVCGSAGICDASEASATASGRERRNPAPRCPRGRGSGWRLRHPMRGGTRLHCGGPNALPPSHAAPGSQTENSRRDPRRGQ